MLKDWLEPPGTPLSRLPKAKDQSIHHLHFLYASLASMAPNKGKTESKQAAKAAKKTKQADKAAKKEAQAIQQASAKTKGKGKGKEERNDDEDEDLDAILERYRQEMEAVSFESS